MLRINDIKINPSQNICIIILDTSSKQLYFIYEFNPKTLQLEICGTDEGNQERLNAISRLTDRNRKTFFKVIEHCKNLLSEVNKYRT